jgi:hypothetical protein
MANAFVLIAPGVEELDPHALGLAPKLILAGRANDFEFSEVERFARASRGWSVLSTFATENSMAAILQGRHALQAGSQIAGFLQEFRGKLSPPRLRQARQQRER